MKIETLTFSGGIFCDSVGEDCGVAANMETSLGGTVLRSYGNFVVQYQTLAEDMTAATGFKLAYTMRPCNGVAGGAAMRTLG